MFPDVEFEPAFGVRGRPGWSPGRLALVTVLQMAEDLTDRQAADAVRERLSWQYALGLGLDKGEHDRTPHDPTRKAAGHRPTRRVAKFDHQGHHGAQNLPAVIIRAGRGSPTYLAAASRTVPGRRRSGAAQSIGCQRIPACKIDSWAVVGPSDVEKR